MRRRTAFTIVQFLALLLIFAVLVALLIPIFSRARHTGGQLKDSTCVSGITQAMVIWGQSNNDQYPLPSLIDKDNATVEAQSTPQAKDCTKNIFSILLYNGFIPVEMAVTPVESNPTIKPFEGYAFSEPPTAAAADKSKALWDPAFRATTSDIGQGVSTTVTYGAVSYALQHPLGDRRPTPEQKFRWGITSPATAAVLGNRGPEYRADGTGDTITWQLVDGPTGTESNTLRIHGSPDTWEGNIGFNDNHVDYINRPDPDNVTFTFSGLPKGKQVQRDNLFVNENDTTRFPDPNFARNTNNFLTIIPSGGITGESKDLKLAPWRD